MLFGSLFKFQLVLHGKYCYKNLNKLIWWFAGESQIGNNVKPLDPKTISSVVRYGKLRYPMTHEATGHSLFYSQLYPFEGLQNYTSGIIHHVRLTGLTLSLVITPKAYSLKESYQYSLILIKILFLYLQETLGHIIMPEDYVSM